MIEIKDLLNNWSNTLFLKQEKKELIRKIISEIINLDIKKEEIEIKNGTIYLNIKPIYKNEVLLKREKIFLKLNEVFKKKAPKNIQ